MEEKMSRNPEEEIYQLIRGQFKAAEKHADRVKDLIKDYYPAYAKLNRTSLLMIMKSIRKDFKREDWPEVKYMFKSIFVYIISDHKPHLHLTHISELIESYPEFSDADDLEKSLLLQFRNLFNVACEIIDPKNHKGELIALVGRMCGAIYVTGGGQTTATDRRVLLYERETGIAPRKQPERKRRADDPATVSLAALHCRPMYFPANAFSSKVPMPNEINPILVKRNRYEAPDTQTLLRSADSFWSYHRALMESGEDIPFKTVPADQAYASFAYPSHDLPTYGHAAAHPSMRFVHDPLRRPQMPMSMQMQLPPQAHSAPLPTPLPLSLQYGGAARPAGTLGGPMPGQGQQQQQGQGQSQQQPIAHPDPHQLPPSLQMQQPRFDYGGYPISQGPAPSHPSYPGHPSYQAMPYAYYDGPAHPQSQYGQYGQYGQQMPPPPPQSHGRAGMYVPPPGLGSHNGQHNGQQGQGNSGHYGQMPGQGQGQVPMVSLQQHYAQGAHPAHGHNQSHSQNYSGGQAGPSARPVQPALFVPTPMSVQNKVN